MADRINFDKKINDSVQVGDELYWAPVPAPAINPIIVGIITGIGDKYVEVGGEINGVIQTATTPTFVANTVFFMFRKPVEENISSLKGYYAEATFTNSVTTKQELFAIGSEITISSK